VPAGYKAVVRDTAHVNYRGYKVTSTIAPSSGTIVLSALNILNGYTLDSVHDPTQPGGLSDSNRTAQIIVESMKVRYTSAYFLRAFKFTY
jgi:gamma-glutamyltranspeptidase/glutathione hydrolase